MQERFRIFLKFLRLYFIELLSQFLIPFCLIFLFHYIFGIEINLIIILIALIVTIIGNYVYEKMDN